MEKIDSGMDETLKDILKDDSSLSNNVVKTLSAIIFDIAYNPTFNRFIEPSINIINSEAENKILPDGVTRDMCIRAIYKEGVMKFCLCTPEECKKVVFNTVSKAKNYTDSNEEVCDQESFYNIVRDIALSRLEAKILIRMADITFVNKLCKHNRCGVITKMLMDIENTRRSLYNEINLNNY